MVVMGVAELRQERNSTPASWLWVRGQAPNLPDAHWAAACSRYLPLGQLGDQYQCWLSPSLGGPCAQHLRGCGISWSGEDPGRGLGLPPKLDLLQVSCPWAVDRSPSDPADIKGLIHIPDVGVREG